MDKLKEKYKKKDPAKKTHKINDGEFLEALQICGGLQQKTADYISEKYGIKYTRWAVHDRIKRKFKDEVKNIKEGNLDRAEFELFKLMESYDENVKLKAIQFYLKSNGRDRGYGDKIEHEGGVTVSWVSDPKNGKSDEID